MNICISQAIHNRSKTAREVGCSPYLVRRVEQVLFFNSANSLVLFPCRTTRAPWRIAPLTLPIILKFMSPPLRCRQWDVTPSTCLRSWKTIFNKSNNTLSQISPVHHGIKEWMPTSLVKSLMTNHKLIKENRSHMQGGREISAILLTDVGNGRKDKNFICNMGSKLDNFFRKWCFLFCFVHVILPISLEIMPKNYISRFILQGRNIIFKNILDVRCSLRKKNGISWEFSGLNYVATL